MGYFFTEPMWQLSLNTGPESYPERPNEPDCIYYLRTGFCGYGARCRFNHPRDRNSVNLHLKKTFLGKKIESLGLICLIIDFYVSNLGLIF